MNTRNLLNSKNNTINTVSDKKINSTKIKSVIKTISAFCLITLLLIPIVKVKSAQASKPLDEILLYSITADVLEDATVDLTYEISWKVLDSTSEGPLEWVQIGIPNSHVNSMTPLSDNIESLKDKSSGGYYAVVDFNQVYIKDDIVNFSFKVNMDYMYQVYPDENVAEYTFTPGWFENIAVDQLVIRWNSDKVEKFEPSGCLMDGGYHVWTASLSPNEKFTIEMTYPLDAFAFDLSEHNDSSSSSSYEYSEHSLFENILFTILMIIMIVIIIGMCALPIALPILIVFIVYKSFTGFGSNGKKITRTIVEYYPSCPNCGGTREEGKEKCSYCGTNMIKSKTEVKEEDLATEDKGVLNYKNNGEFKFSDNPNRYVRVHVVPVVVSRPTTTSHSSSSHHSSCAHSSCACACACACAGGGRAGCTTKDFYNTDMKLSYLKKYKKTNKNK